MINPSVHLEVEERQDGFYWRIKGDDEWDGPYPNTAAAMKAAGELIAAAYVKLTKEHLNLED